MKEANIKIISDLKQFISDVYGDVTLLDFFRTTKKAFTRERKLPFEKLALMVLHLSKKTLSVELEHFFQQAGFSNPCTVSAFTQHRCKLKPLLFYFWNIALWTSFYLHYQNQVKRWRGYRLIAGDGSNISLVNNEELNNHFGGQSNQHKSFVQAKTFYYYDVLNELILFPQIHPYRYGELNMAYEGIDMLEQDMLTIYDRNFSNYKIMALHMWQEKETKFVIRGKEKLKFVSHFLKSGQASAIVHLPPTASAIKGLKKSGYIIGKDTLLTIRLVRVELDNKTTEVLITNLMEEEGHETDLFKELYFMRWGVETNISTQKNILRLESFSGLSVNVVLQEFYATVMMTNLHAILIKEPQQNLEEESKIKERKYPMKINKNKSFGKLKVNLVKLFITQNPEEILDQLYLYFLNDPVPVRKGRTFPRIRKNPQTKSKHKTFTNYKPAY